jgi:hypothetical protein
MLVAGAVSDGGCMSCCCSVQLVTLGSALLRHTPGPLMQWPLVVLKPLPAVLLLRV